MDIKYNHEKILMIVALVLCAGILFYNAFFIPDISIPSVIYINSENNIENSADSNSDSSDSSSSSDSSLNSDSSNSSAKTENKESTKSGTKININTASEEELAENLNGVGPATAKKIVDYRNTIGKFSSIDEIKNVSGIGDKTFEKFKDIICV